jgi:tripartite-type tricarboxylate transporter receptor subunit TctC
MNRRKFWSTLGASLLVASSFANAQNYPASPVKIIVPYVAGGGIDAVARMLAQGMQQELGQAFIVDNRGGAGGLIGADAAAKAAPDGYTLLLGGNPELTITPSLQAKPPYNSTTAFTPIVLVAQSPNVFVANPSLGAKTLREALEAAKKKPGGISIATPGNGTAMHIAVELLRQETGLEITHVPYKGAAPATLAALSGEVTFALVGAPPALPHIQSGKLVALAVTQPKRSALLPNVPTIGEALNVMKDADIVTWYGLLAPARTPAPIVQTLEKAAAAVLKRPETKERLTALGTDLVAMPAPQFADRIRNESQRYAEVVKKFHIKPD